MLVSTYFQCGTLSFYIVVKVKNAIPLIRNYRCAFKHVTMLHFAGVGLQSTTQIRFIFALVLLVVFRKCE